jgi:hypothetical protein
MPVRCARPTSRMSPSCPQRTTFRSGASCAIEATDAHSQPGTRFPFQREGVAGDCCELRGRAGSHLSGVGRDLRVPGFKPLRWLRGQFSVAR